MKKAFLFFTGVLVFMISSLPALCAMPAVVDDKPLPSLAPLLKKVQDGVVNISAESTKIILRRNNRTFQRFFDAPAANLKQRLKKQNLGSGVIFDKDKGLIVTNAHLIQGADVITVTLNDGRETEAQLIGADKVSDLAVLKINLKGLSQIALGDSDAIQVGDFVVTIGNPFGLQQTVSSGIVSGFGHIGMAGKHHGKFIQTDALINSGNSGGALINLNGELIGVNTAILSPSVGSTGIGFSIPVNTMVPVKDQLIAYGKVRRGHLGILVQELTPTLAGAFNLQHEKGVVITKVKANSSAEKAGMQLGDIILTLNKHNILSKVQLTDVLNGLLLGDTMDFDIIRNGVPQSISASMSEHALDNSIGEHLHTRLSGAIFQSLPKSKLPEGLTGGIFVKSVIRGDEAWRNGLRENDVIISVNRKAVTSLENLHLAVEQQQSLLLNIIRNDSALYLLLR